MIPISFVDFTHTGKTIDTKFFPLGVAYVAAYAKEVFKDSLDVDIFKYPSEYSDYLDKKIPQVACFSNFSWNFRLGYEYAKQIKLRSPKTVTVFGGPNYGHHSEEQEQFLKEHPYIDFYIIEEGEFTFAALLKELIKYDFDINALVKGNPPLPGIHYYKNGTFTRNATQPRIQELSVIPSPILTGLMDKFILGGYIPMVQTTRGCPYSCSFCHDGNVYQNKLKRFPTERYQQEIEYIAQRTKVPHLMITDLNFGIFEEDYETAKFIAEIKKKYNWPQTVDLTAAKNHKERISRIVELFGNTYLMGASVQSTDPEVLSAIKRTNLPFPELVKMAKKSAEFGGNSYSEVILCLPGDSKRAHFKSVLDLMDGHMDEVRMYQFILLAGTVGGSNESRLKYGYKTKWRALPRCFGKYKIFGKEFPIAEIHEVCIEHNTMSHQDYLDCRKLNLIVEIFNNGKIFGELFRFLDFLGLSRANIIQEIYTRAMKDQGAAGRILKDFEENEAKSFFPSREVLEDFVAKPENLDRYLRGELGINQIMTFRGQALLQHLEYNAKLIFDIARDELKKSGQWDETKALYLDELCDYILSCRGELLSIDKDIVKKYHFDFTQLFLDSFTTNPLETKVEEGIEIVIGHSAERKKEINENLNLYGRSADGLGHYIQRGNVFRLYREPRYKNAPRSANLASPSL
jgi:tRNA A37 methylthiotransferase MiaB